MLRLTCSAFAGILADRSPSRQRPLLVGLMSMLGATLLFQFGPTIYVLLVARFFQGISAALLYSAGLALLCDNIGKGSLGYAMGYITLAITAATFVGPTLGGVLYEYGGEITVFAVAYAVIAVDVVARLTVVEKRQLHGRLLEEQTTDYGTVDSPTSNAERPEPAGYSTQPHRWPVLFTLLSTSRLLLPLFGWVVLGIFLSAFDSILPIFVTSIYNWSYAGAGLVFIPLFIPNLAGPLFGRLVDSSPRAPRFIAAVGFLLSAVPFVLLRLVESGETKLQWLFVGLLLVIGLGMALSGPPLLVEIFSTVEAMEDRDPDLFGKNGATAQAYGLYNSALAAGQLLGALLGGFALQKLGWAFLMTAFGVVSGFTGVITLLYLSGPLWKSKEEQSQCLSDPAEAEAAVRNDLV